MKEATTEYMEEPIEGPIPDLEIPKEGKAWRRKSDGIVYVGAVFLGKLFFLNGERLDEPIDEKPEDFELIDIEIEKTENQEPE